MADEDQAPSDIEVDPQIVIPSHSPLPTPPDISYNRPKLGQAASGSNSSKGDKSSRGAFSAEDVGSHGAAMAAGLSFITSIIAGALIGSWIDKRWNHTGTPWATFIMLALGTAAGFLNLYRILARINRKKN